MTYTMKDHSFGPDNEHTIYAAFTENGEYVGDEKTAKMLYDKMGIIPEYKRKDSAICSIGFCEQEQKWYGWSHRAIYGFGIGSEVKKGDCAYVADTPEKLIQQHVDWCDYDDAEKQEQRRNECQILEDRSGIRILHSPLVIPMAKSVDDVLAAVDGEDVETEDHDIYGGENAIQIIKCGKGEWTAKTLDDAKEMAIAFADSVS